MNNQQIRITCEYCKEKVNKWFTIYKNDNCESDYIRICDYCYTYGKKH